VQKEQEKANLTKEIDELEKQLVEIQKKLADKKTQNDGINQKYKNTVEAIEQKITNAVKQLIV
jgi:peptidoglycan hydrolase CwlO-like protein